MLAAYCETWARFVEATRDVQANGLTIVNRSTRKDGTESEWTTTNPAVGIAKAAGTELRGFAAHFGLTPSTEVAPPVARWCGCSPTTLTPADRRGCRSCLVTTIVYGPLQGAVNHGEPHGEMRITAAQRDQLRSSTARSGNVQVSVRTRPGAHILAGGPSRGVRGHGVAPGRDRTIGSSCIRMSGQRRKSAERAIGQLHLDSILPIGAVLSDKACWAAVQLESSIPSARRR
ncbi:P27 family phage terminase small subunit [Saccharopolyspora soli]|uniref:P27 family phage terminase small subunit n=1 Tax=Saccharopolyspora soli TaxID=2926618 RepID=UPI0035573648